MKKRSLQKNKQTQRVRRERDPIPWKYCFLTLVCGLFLVVGFFAAARQHFSSIDLGIKNSKMRRQIDELEAEKRRLLLAKEVALSPGEIKKAAKKIGLKEMTADNIEVIRASTVKDEKPKAEKTSETQTAKNETLTANGDKKAEKKTEAKPDKKSTDAKEKPVTRETKTAKSVSSSK